MEGSRRRSRHLTDTGGSTSMNDVLIRSVLSKGQTRSRLSRILLQPTQELLGVAQNARLSTRQQAVLLLEYR